MSTQRIQVISDGQVSATVPGPLHDGDGVTFVVPVKPATDQHPMTQPDPQGAHSKAGFDQGARTLAERLNAEIDNDGRQWDWSDCVPAILGSNGLFIADVTKHEPGIIGSAIGCVCGWRWSGSESYFVHLSERTEP